jgi:hypothetical protein
LISRHIADLHCDSLREQVYKITEILANELQISMTDAELSSIFGRKRSWSRGMICEYLHQLSSSHALHPGRPRSISEDLEAKLVRFCFTGQHNKSRFAIFLFRNPDLAQFNHHITSKAINRFFDALKSSCQESRRNL